MGIIMTDLKLLNLLQVCDSLFPIGTFTLSNGLETLVQNETIRDSFSMKKYCLDYLSVLPYGELGAAALAYQTESETDLLYLDQLMAAGRGPEELRTGSRKLCIRFLKAEEKIKPGTKLLYYNEMIQKKQAYGSHGIVFGLFAKEQGIDLQTALTVFGYSLMSAMITNSVKLIPLSQLDGQKILNELFSYIGNAVKTAGSISIEDIGISGAGLELSSMEHETLYSRMYIS